METKGVMAKPCQFVIQLGQALAFNKLAVILVQSLNGKHVILAFQFITGCIRKHRDYADLVRPDMQRAFKI